MSQPDDEDPLFGPDDAKFWKNMAKNYRELALQWEELYRREKGRNKNEPAS